MPKNNRRNWAVILFLTATFSHSLWALVPTDDSIGVRQKSFKHPDLTISNVLQQTNQLPSQAAAIAQKQLSGLGLAAAQGHFDVRGGRWGTLLLKQPLLPGNGVGNNTKWLNGPPANEAAYRFAAWDAFFDFLKLHESQLNIDPDEMAQPGKVTVHDGGTIIQIYAPRLIDDIPVRDNYVNGVINRGNLILLGANTWGNINISTQPGISIDDAINILKTSLGKFAIADFWGLEELNIVPLAKGQNIKQITVGDGYDYRLVWVIKPLFKDDVGRWEALVDAETGEVLSFEDTNHYAETKGGVLPVSNDGIIPDGVEQAGWPMPFVNVNTSSSTLTTDTGGNLSATGSMTSTLTGPFIRMNDNCGAISLTQNDNLDFGTSTGTDCTTPGFGGPGNTHSSRTGFYELNKIKEMGRGQLPSNSWLQNQLTANMNINDTCNAFWNGSTVNFFKSGGGCSNTGEIAGVFDHEWGHGLDANDATPGIASPSGEGIADIYTALRLNDSCIGRNFLPSVCGGNGDPCLTCTGVRDIDYLKRQSGNPHDFSWSNANCGGSVHCVGGVYSEAVWSLWKRELQSAPYNMDNNTAHEVVTRLTYIGAGATGTWFSGSPPNGGCAATSGYMNYLAADDDNGDLSDGTPHMTAIYSAFNDQEIACGSPAMLDVGCVNTPLTAPNVTITSSNQTNSLNWGSVTHASKYQIFRTEGVFACDFGKVKLGETSGTNWNDNNLQNGRQYSYVVIPIGAADSCMGPASACDSVFPASGPDLKIDNDTYTLNVGGDNDAFLDNCESGTLTFDITNIGLGPLTNIRIVSVSPSNPGVTVDTSFPSAISPPILNPNETGSGFVSFTAGDLVPEEILTFQIEVTADELASSRLAYFSVDSTETDFLVLTASKTWDFETDLDGWSVIQGTFNQKNSGGGANGSSGYMASSANLDMQCDEIRSPTLRLTNTSTVSIETNFDIEPASSGQWWDRANVAIYENGIRGSKDPDGGRLHNASGIDSHCDTVSGNGWADVQTTWAPSTISSTALGSAALAGKEVQIDVAYATDPALTGQGFSFDQVTVTNVETIGADQQPNFCGPLTCTVNNDCSDGLFCNGTETCNTGLCQAGTPPVCDDGVSCTIDSCNEATDSCDNLADDTLCNDGLFCNGVETCDSTLACVIGIDPCTGTGETCNEDNDLCVVNGCGNGVCELGEDCTNCTDCLPQLPIPAVACGNGICEAGDGEDCTNCPSDCNGKTSGKPSDRFCCGVDDGLFPDGCGDDRCNEAGVTCTEDPAPPTEELTCCGDTTCESPEDALSCNVDCGASCDPSEVGSCSDGFDNDCDNLTDCADLDDCGTDPVCNLCDLGQKGEICSSNSDCCSGTCKRNNTCR